MASIVFFFFFDLQFFVIVSTSLKRKKKKYYWNYYRIYFINLTKWKKKVIINLSDPSNVLIKGLLLYLQKSLDAIVIQTNGAYKVTKCHPKFGNIVPLACLHRHISFEAETSNVFEKKKIENSIACVQFWIVYIYSFYQNRFDALSNRILWSNWR